MAVAWLGNHYSAAVVMFRRHAIRGVRRGTGLGKSGDQFRPADITFWGVFALVTWAVALGGATFSFLLPSGVLGGLHTSRLEGATLNQLRGQVKALEAETAELKQANAVLLQRFSLNEESAGEVTRRVGALEMTVPQMLDALNARPGVDPGTTASTRTGPVVSFDVDGGSVSYNLQPLQIGSPDVATAEQAMPPPLTTAMPDSAAFGIALGPPIDADEGEDAWRSMNTRVGTLLVGLAPMLASVEGGSGKRLVVGPIAVESDARQICGRMAKVGIACATVPFVGTPLPLTN